MLYYTIILDFRIAFYIFKKIGNYQVVRLNNGCFQREISASISPEDGNEIHNMYFTFYKVI